MDFTLKPITGNRGLALHSQFGYAYCPYHQDTQIPCGTWCALFRLGEGNLTIIQGCCNNFVKVEVQDAETS